jgi:hypothetical protein
MRDDTKLAPPDRLSTTISSGLCALIGGLSVGTRFEVRSDSDMCGALELFFPRLLRIEYQEWLHESLDGIFIESAIKKSENSVVIAGVCILIRDQTLTPFESEISISSSGDDVVGCALQIGEPGGGALAISGPSCNSTDAVLYRANLMARLDNIEWVFHFPRNDKDTHYV